MKCFCVRNVSRLENIENLNIALSIFALKKRDFEQKNFYFTFTAKIMSCQSYVLPRPRINQIYRNKFSL